MIEQAAAPDPAEKTAKARRNITYLLLFAIVMFFAALTSAYVVAKGSTEYWVHIKIPTPFYWSTIIVVLGSVLMQGALVLVRKGNAKALPILFALTMISGVGFTLSQWEGWKDLRAKGNVMSFSNILQPTGQYGVDYAVQRKGVELVRTDDGQYYAPDDAQHERPLNAEMAEQVNGASQFFYVLTIAHGVHVLGGLIVLLVLLIKSAQGRYSATAHTGIWQGAMYWHFLGGLWIYLLLFLSFVH